MTSAETRPFPPGEYPIVVVGSGPGAIQLTYALDHLGIDHATISADEAPGGMFRKWPFFQRLLSWTKPYAPEDRSTRAFERWDWNSMIAEEPEHRALQAEFMDGSSDFPSRPEMEQSLAAFVERTGTRIRYGCRWTATRREPGPDGDRFVIETTDGEYRCRFAIFAVGVAEPWNPPTPGIEHAAHYADTRPAEEYAGKRVFLIGKQNSGFELASGLLQWAGRITLASPSPPKLSVVVNSLNGVRARYVQPFEDSALGFGVDILNASIEQISRVDGGALRVDLRQTGDGSALTVDADVVISATGFTCPLQDLPELGVATFGQAKVPAQTAYWESATVPGIYFAGTITQGAAGLKKHGMPSFSGAVQGHRYNARILARYLGEKHFGIPPEHPLIAPRDLLDVILDEATGGPELWHQKGYLARSIRLGDDGPRDEGIVPLTAALDATDGDAITLTVEADGTGAIYPVVYVRQGGRTTEHTLDPHPLLDFRTSAHRRQLADVLKRVVPSLA